MSARLTIAAVVLACALGAPVALAAPPGRWLAGDLHAHTTYSHDSYGGPTDDNTGPGDAYTLGHSVTSQFTVAASRGLDFLAITDHNDIRSQTDPGFGAGGVLPIPAYENSIAGHAQMLGARRIYDNGDKGVAAARALADALHGDGGVIQANHPIDPKWEYGYDVPVDSVEVWNLPWYYQSPLPAASDNDGALAYWYGWLDRGAHVAATGGSDNHYVSTSAAQGVGQPTTWVYARGRSVTGVLGGIRAGHTFVSHEPPGYRGAQAFLEADGDRDGSFESIVGDTVPPGSPLRVRVTGAAGASLRIVGDGGHPLGDPVAVSSDDFTYRFKAPAETTWVHAQVYGEDRPTDRGELCTTVFGADLAEQTTYCRNRVAMLALTSALYLRAPSATTSPSAGVAGRARLHVPRRCVRRPFRLSVSGTRIARVRFFVDARPVRARTGAHAVRVDPRRLTNGLHRALARVRFSDGRSVALGGRFRTCARPAPRFAG